MVTHKIIKKILCKKKKKMLDKIGNVCKLKAYHGYPKGGKKF